MEENIQVFVFPILIVKGYYKAGNRMNVKARIMDRMTLLGLASSFPCYMVETLSMTAI